MKKSWLFLLAAWCLAIGMAVFLAGCAEKSVEENFPEWREVTKEYPIEPTAELAFLGIDFGTYESEDGTVVFDEVLIHLKNTSSHSISKRDAYWVEYLYNDKWYIVYSQSFQEGYAAIYSAHEEKDLSFLVPAGLFDTPGMYRLYYLDTWYCDIEILFNANEAATDLNLEKESKS